MSDTLSIIDRLVSGQGPKQDSAAVADTIGRDLLLLLNSWARLERQAAERHKTLQSSVLNYGVEGIAGQSLQPQTLEAYERTIRAAVERFEPRLDADTIQVSAQPGGAGRSSTEFTLRISGQMIAEGGTRQLVFDSLVNSDTGRVNLI
ncbi:MAG: type VI secretion system baseplate subunit TssE [Phycisphaerales bacterium]|nr:type VI secretion system baseplate subunit TssE [Phycisphaerales bacterium]